MNKNIYAVPGTNFSQIDLCEYSQCPEGFVVMTSERPSNDHICVILEQGKGVWIERKISIREKIARVFSVLNSKIKVFHHRIKIYKYLYILKNRGHYFLRSTNKYYNSLLPNNERKLSSMLILLSTLVVANTFESSKNPIIFNISLSLIAAIIFEIILNQIPKEEYYKIQAKKLEIMVSKIIEVKNIIFINAKFLQNPWVGVPVEHSDDAFDIEKFNFISFNINSYSNISPIIDIYQYTQKKSKTNKELMLDAIFYLKKISEEIKFEINFENFRLTEEAINRLLTDIEHINLFKTPLEHPEGCKDYTKFILINIEKIQLTFALECYKYLNYRSGFYNYNLKFNKRSINFLIN